MIDPVTPTSFVRGPARWVRLALGLVVGVGACNQPPAVNPWRDDSIPPDAWSTPSRDGIIAAAGNDNTLRRRQVPETRTPYVQPDVPHYPLWWEDPLEDKGDQNADFAWTWQDYVAMPYSFGRFLLNTMGWPVSAVVTPPGTPMVSDGSLRVDPKRRCLVYWLPEHPHDAYYGHSPDPTAARSDFVYAESDAPVSIQPSTRPAS